MTSATPSMAPFSTKEKLPPLGLGFIMSVLKKVGHEVYFVDNYLKPSNVLETNFLVKNNIDFVGIYSNTICYDSTLEMFEKLQKMREKKIWNGKIIVGGPHTSVGKETIPEYVDYVVIGEGEKTVLDIIEGKIQDRVVIGEKILNLDSLPMPAWEEFVNLPYKRDHEWIESFPVYTLNTSRGCPFSCTFCSVKSIWGKTYRFMSAKRIIKDILHLQKYYGAKCIYFREDHFTLNKKRVIEFCEFLLQNNIKIDWMCETRVDQLDDYDYQTLMAKAGCKAFYIGVESGSQRMLDFFKKGEKVEQFIRAFDIAHMVGIKTYASFIVGTPTETEDDIKLTEKLIEQIKPDYTGKNIYVGIPGSELYDYVLNNNLYEFKDNKGLLYLKGHNERVDTYYGGNPYFKIPSPSVKRKITLFSLKNSICSSLSEIKQSIKTGVIRL